MFFNDFHNFAVEWKFLNKDKDSPKEKDSAYDRIEFQFYVDAKLLNGKPLVVKDKIDPKLDPTEHDLYNALKNGFAKSYLLVLNVAVSGKFINCATPKDDVYKTVFSKANIYDFNKALCATPKPLFTNNCNKKIHGDDKVSLCWKPVSGAKTYRVVKADKRSLVLKTDETTDTTAIDYSTGMNTVGYDYYVYAECGPHRTKQSTPLHIHVNP